MILRPFASTISILSPPAPAALGGAIASDSETTTGAKHGAGGDPAAPAVKRPFRSRHPLR